MIYEIHENTDEVEGLDDDGRPDPAYAAALGLLQAPFGRRAAAAVTDWLIWAVLQVPLCIGALPLLLKVATGSISPYGFVNHPAFVFAVVMTAVTVVLSLVFTIVQWVLHARQGVTIGKAAFGLRSVNVRTLARPKAFPVLLRLLVVWVAGIVPVVGQAAVLASPMLDPDRRGRGWHDKLSGVWLVDVRNGLNPYDEKRMRVARKMVKADPTPERAPLPSLATPDDPNAQPVYRPGSRVSAGVLGVARPYEADDRPVVGLAQTIEPAVASTGGSGKPVLGGYRPGVASPSLAATPPAAVTPALPTLPPGVRAPAPAVPQVPGSAAQRPGSAPTAGADGDRAGQHGVPAAGAPQPVPPSRRDRSAAAPTRDASLEATAMAPSSRRASTNQQQSGATTPPSAVPQAAVLPGAVPAPALPPGAAPTAALPGVAPAAALPQGAAPTAAGQGVPTRRTASAPTRDGMAAAREPGAASPAAPSSPSVHQAPAPRPDEPALRRPRRSTHHADASTPSARGAQGDSAVAPGRVDHGSGGPEADGASRAPEVPDAPAPGPRRSRAGAPATPTAPPTPVSPAPASSAPASPASAASAPVAAGPAARASATPAPASPAPAPASPAVAPASPAPASPAPAGAVRFGIRFDSGEVVAVDGALVLGRNPDATGYPGARAHLLADDTRSLSKTHLFVRVVAEGLEVTDCGSSNGSSVRRGEVERELTPGQPLVLAAGDVIRLGDRTAAVISR